MHMNTIVSLFTTICVVLTNTKMWKVNNVCLYDGGGISEFKTIRVSEPLAAQPYPHADQMSR